MKISVLKRKSQQMKKFDEIEWKHWDVEHFGRKIKWYKKTYFLKVYEGKEILGTMELKVEARVGKIKTLVVKRSKLRQGVGGLLMKKAEEIVKKHKGHKLVLTTGKNWESTRFYEVMGFRKTGNFPNHFFNVDFILMAKFI